MPSCALAIGGLDPGGGAGIAADLRAFHAAGVFGCGVVALITVQSTDGLVACRPVASELVVRQAEEVMRAQRVRAIKLGALGSIANVRALARWLSRRTDVPVVLDPVMFPTRGTARLLAKRAGTVLRDELLARATLVTPNTLEAAELTGHPFRTVAGARKAARRLVELGARAALVKGGHLSVGREVVDVLALGPNTVVEMRGPRLQLAQTHGGGCVLASLIAGLLAGRSGGLTDVSIEAAVREARRIHQKALRYAIDVGGATRVLVP